MQAGSSETGKELAAETAEVVFTAQPTLELARAFYGDLKGRVAKYGRSPDHLLIMPGVMPIIGQSRTEANEHFERLQASIHPTVGLSLLADMLGGADLSGYPLDEPLPEQLPETLGNKSRVALITEMARRDKLTVRQLYTKIAGARGHWTVVGTATDIADQIEDRFVKRGADGFNVMPAYLPGSLDEFVHHVVPKLQDRGLFRLDYEGRTLRDNLGLPRPPHPARSI